MALLQGIKKRFGPLLDNQARIFKLLRSPRIDSKEPIPPGYVAWRASTKTLFLLGSSSPIDCLKIPALLFIPDFA